MPSADVPLARPRTASVLDLGPENPTSIRRTPLATPAAASVACAVTVTERGPFVRSTVWVLNVRLVSCGGTVSAGGAHNRETDGVAPAAGALAASGVTAVTATTAIAVRDRRHTRALTGIAFS
jgi:hypothetical protein